MLEGGADIRYIQQMLGHAEITTTQIYAQVSIRHLQTIHTATHPAAANTPRRARATNSHGVVDNGEPDDAERRVRLLALLETEDQEENRAHPAA